MKNGPPVMIITIQSGSRKTAWPTRSMMSRTRLGSVWFTMSIRMCSLSSNVQGEHSRNTMLNSTHCSSSHELEETSKLLRTMALAAETITATKMSQARRLPVHRVNTSIPLLTFNIACNGNPPQFASAVLTAYPQGVAAYPAGLARSHRTKPAGGAAVNWKFVDIERELAAGAGYQSTPADAGTIAFAQSRNPVAAVRSEAPRS